MSQVTDDTCTDGNRDGRSPRTFLIRCIRIILGTGCYITFADFYFIKSTFNLIIGSISQISPFISCIFRFTAIVYLAFCCCKLIPFKFNFNATL